VISLWLRSSWCQQNHELRSLIAMVIVLAMIHSYIFYKMLKQD